MSVFDGFIGLGSNLRRPTCELERALARLEAHDVVVGRVSSFYHTEPVGGPRQPWYVNAVAGIRFSGSPHELLRACQSIEKLAGRRRTVANAPRVLDLDLLLFGDRVVRSSELTLPHPRLAERRFVLVPLVEIAPDAVHPVSGLTASELLARCADPASVVRLEHSAVATPDP